jgi:tripartite-type tricarboxylate transporter receptor subunit TctC
VPAGTPDEAVTFLSDLLRRVNDNPEYVAKMEAAGFAPTYRDAAGFQFVVTTMRR